MEFSPHNHIVQLCIKAMSLEDNGDNESAYNLFMQAWNEASNEFEKFLAAYYIAKHQTTAADRLQWLNTALELAMIINDHTVESALPGLYQKISTCYEDLNDLVTAKEYAEKIVAFNDHITDEGPFYHGTKAALQVGDLLTAGGNSNYQSQLKMNHIYFTAVINGAGLAAELAKGNGEPRVYIVTPTGTFENDPNVTDKKFPGNPTRSYRSKEPLKIIGEITDWIRLTPAQLQSWKERLANNKGEIIN